MRRVIVFVLSFLFCAALAVYAQDSGPLQTYLLDQPCRFVDTRTDPVHHRLVAGTASYLPIVGGSVCPIPQSAEGVVLNVTIVGPSGAGYLTVWSASASRPGTSTLNYVAGQTVANAATVRTPTTDPANVAVFSSSGADVIVDVVGYLR